MHACLLTNVHAQNFKIDPLQMLAANEKTFGRVHVEYFPGYRVEDGKNSSARGEAGPDIFCPTSPVAIYKVAVGGGGQAGRAESAGFCVTNTLQVGLTWLWSWEIVRMGAGCISRL